ncbi:Gfo/Idh/MocA family oxidoreductase [Geitlerinema sp. PCC 9228]|jgi:hypothetical protein|uniref:Gfo/Idh/MocA family protein n=1 Tax=Geitlerinema sp. PCC 9228 TaxID=111611 RepID=UPI0008F9D7CF|nr:Gfo/Idh/MocA family oxidoreductase [Geitlerinema sp. PCC 9228]
MSKDIGVAVIGTGFGKKVHIPGFREHPRTRVVAVYHRNINKATQIASEEQIPYACDRVEDILSMSEVRGVSIATPPFLHYEMAKQVLQAGKHLILEKPMTLNVGEAKELYRIAQNTGAVVTPDFEYRCVPTWQMLAQLLESGYVGQKRFIQIDWIMASRADANRPWNWYALREKGGGALGALGSHSFDYIPWLFGPVRRLQAQLKTTVTSRPDPETGDRKTVDSDDVGFINLEMADGTPCQFTLSSVAYQGRGHWVEIYGDRGTLVLGSGNQKDYVHGFHLYGSQDGSPLAEMAVAPEYEFSHTYKDGRLAPFVRIVDRWVQGIDSGKPELPTLREGVYSQLLMDLTHESSDRQEVVEVPALESILGSDR